MPESKTSWLPRRTATTDGSSRRNQLAELMRGAEILARGYGEAGGLAKAGKSTHPGWR